MAMRTYHKGLVFVLTIVASLALVLGAAGPVKATQNAPSWGTGNQWTYSVTGSSSITSDQWLVKEQTTITIGTMAYPVWHVVETTTSTSGSTTTTVSQDLWLTVSGIALAKSFTSISVPILGYLNTTVTYNPPMPTVQFPLSAGASWSGSTTRTLTINSFTTTANVGYSGQVLGESQVTVPAGTFTAAQARVPASGNPYTVFWYSESAGYFVEIQTYDSTGALTSTESLASYSYTGNLLLWILIGIVVLAVIAVTGLLFLRRRRGPRAPYPARYPPQYPYPPQQPPQQPPQAPPPGGP